MSLVQRADLGKGVLTVPSAQNRGAENPAISLLRRVQTESRRSFDFGSQSRPAGQASQTGEAAKAASEIKGHSLAINLIEEVSSILPVLVDENDQLRELLKANKEKADVDLQNATMVAFEWRKSAETAKLRVETLETALAEMTRRLEQAQAMMAAEQENAHKAAQEAAEAECLSSLFEEKLLTSFGAGSPFQTAMDRIRSRGVVEAA